MKWQNKVQLIGYLGSDPTIYTLPKGGSCAVLWLATHSGFTKAGTKRETFWHKVRVWSKDMTGIRQQFIKGSHVLVEGSLVYRNFFDTAGVERSCAEIRAERLINLDR